MSDLRGWFLAGGGKRLHAVHNGHGMCGLRSGAWHPGSDADALCLNCGAMYGPAFPAPPGREHSSSHMPWFADYAEARGRAGGPVPEREG